MQKKFVFLVLSFLHFSIVSSDMISDKKEGLSQVNSTSERLEKHAKKFNQEIAPLKEQLYSYYREVESYYFEESTQDKYEEILFKVKNIKKEIDKKNKEYREQIDFEGFEEYALMHSPQISIEEIVIDYGSSGFLYYIPEDIAKMKLSLCSSIPIPKASWEEVLSIILLQNGIGIRKENNYLKSLYLIKSDQSLSLKYVTNNPKDLDILPQTEMVCFIFTPERSQLNKSFYFLEKFSSPKKTKVQLIREEIIIVAPVEQVKELLYLYQFVEKTQKEKQYKLISLSKISSKEMKNILATFFPKETLIQDNKEKEFNSIIILALENGTNSLFLLGSQKDLEQAEKIAIDIENSIDNPKEKAVFAYTCKYSDAQDLAEVLERVYIVMSSEGISDNPDLKIEKKTKNKVEKNCNRDGTNPPICDPPSLVVNPKPVDPDDKSEKRQTLSKNFIVDPQTGMIIMVVEQEYISHLKNLIKKLDIPKKMVQLELLLFEKKVTDQSQFGLKLLAVGQQAKNKHETSAKWEVNSSNKVAQGILDFLFSRMKTKSGIPAYDIAYNFLISQEDIQIHSSPSITTINQTPANIDLVEEQSINMGTVEDPRTGTISNTYVRAQYGIFIEITPTVNSSEDFDERNDYVTLHTNITFDTTTSSVDDRPDVSRRHIQNQVRIGDGQTVILGGLRRKTSEDVKDKIPFLGDIPAIGKLFSYETQLDKTTEMFIFITPKIIKDPIEDLERVQKEELVRRPGDIPELLEKLEYAKDTELALLMEKSLNQLLYADVPNG